MLRTGRDFEVTLSQTLFHGGTHGLWVTKLALSGLAACWESQVGHLGPGVVHVPRAGSHSTSSVTSQTKHGP